MGGALKRSHEPLFWALFGAGGVLSALIGPVLILNTGILVPLGLGLPHGAFSYARALAFARNPLGAAFLLAVIALFLFHGCHRMVHSLHDLGWRTGVRAQIAFYGFATAGSLVTLILLLAIRASAHHHGA